MMSDYNQRSKNAFKCELEEESVNEIHKKKKKKMRLLQTGIKIVCRVDSRQKIYDLRFVLPKSSVSGNEPLQPGKYLITPAASAAPDPFFSF
jgi:hypothetical protein